MDLWREYLVNYSWGNIVFLFKHWMSRQYVSQMLAPKNCPLWWTAIIVKIIQQKGILTSGWIEIPKSDTASRSYHSGSSSALTHSHLLPTWATQTVHLQPADRPRPPHEYWTITSCLWSMNKGEIIRLYTVHVFQDLLWPLHCWKFHRGHVSFNSSVIS